jgi:hypothetical protein
MLLGMQKLHSSFRMTAEDCTFCMDSSNAVDLLGGEYSSAGKLQVLDLFVEPDKANQKKPATGEGINKPDAAHGRLWK